jgi:hypothetical protein
MAAPFSDGFIHAGDESYSKLERPNNNKNIILIGNVNSNITV